MSEYFIIDSSKSNRMGKIKILSSPESLNSAASPIAWNILKQMRVPQCPTDIAKKTGISEQTVYYHVRKLKKAGLIVEAKTEQRLGTVAHFYKVTSGAFGILIPHCKMEKVHFAAPRYNKNLEPFIVDGKQNFTIVVGSPEPHGPFRARAADSMCAIDLALFLGSFTEGIEKANYKLDVEMRDSDLKKNLILIGGPVANMITRKLNNKFPIKILLRHERCIYSTLSRKRYESDYAGFIIVTDNPWANGKKIMILAGKRFQGTRAAILFVIKKLDKIFEGNKFNRNMFARVVMGYDMDGDGVIDTAELLE